MKVVEIIKKHKVMVSILTIILIVTVGMIAFNMWMEHIPKDYNVLIHNGSMQGYNVYYIYDDYIIAISESGGLTADGLIQNKTKTIYYYDSMIDLTDITENKGEKMKDDLILYGHSSDCIKIIGDATYKFSAFDVLGELLKNSTNQKIYNIK